MMNRRSIFRQFTWTFPFYVLFGLGLLLGFPEAANSLTGSTRDRVPDFVIPVGGCTGVLIAPTWILTARHVAAKIPPGRGLALGDQSSTVEQVHLSPNFQPTAPGRVPVNDIALIELTRPIHLDRYPSLVARVTDRALQKLAARRLTIALYQHVPADPPSEFRDGKEVLFPGKHVAQMAETSVKFLGSPDRFLTLVISEKDGVMLESGDSGAPMLVEKETVIAIAHSVGKSAEDGMLGFFGFVGNDRDWINQTTGFDVRWANLR